MSGKKYAIGIDFGTLSGRAVLVDVTDGRVVASAVDNHANGVIDHTMPESGKQLPPEWAMQNTNDGS